MFFFNMAGVWNEYNTVYEKAQKQWQQYEENKPKLAVNWDRTAKRELKPAPAPAPAQTKKPKKPTNKKAEAGKQNLGDVELEDIEFKTPPLTPPSKPPERIHVAKSVAKDDDFWDFYDQPTLPGL